MALQLRDGFLHLLARSGPETVELDVSCLGCNHVTCPEGVDRNLVAFKGEVDEVLVSVALYSEFYLCTLGSAQHAHDAVTFHLHSCYGHVVACDEPVSCHDAGLFARSLRDGLYDDEGVFEHIELHADTFEVPFEGFVEFLCLLGIGIGGVRVEFFEHTVDGILHQLVLVYAVDVELCDGQLCNLQFPQQFYIDVLVVFVALQLCDGGVCTEEDGEEQIKESFHGSAISVLWRCYTVIPP